MKSLPSQWYLNGTFRSVLFLILFIAGSRFYSMASDDMIDSLRGVISKHPSDEEVAKAMITLAGEFITIFRDDSVRKYAGKALELATKIDDEETITRSYILICRDYWKYGHLPEALATSRPMLYYANKTKNDDLLTKAIYHQGVVYGMMGQSDSAIYCFRKSLKTVKSDTVTIIASYLGLGNNFTNIGVHDSALHYTILAARISELSGKKDKLVAIYYGIGITLDQTGQLQESEKYFRLGLKLAEELKDPESIANGLLHLAGVFYRRAAYDSSLFYLDRSKSLYKGSGDTTGWSELYDYYGLIYSTQGKYDQALIFYDSAIYVTKKSNTLPDLMANYRNKSGVYASLNNYGKTWEYLDSACMIAVECGFSNDQMIILHLMGQISYLSGNYKRSAEELDSAYVMRDSLFSENKIKANVEIIQKYEKEKDQAQILKLEKDALKKTLQRNLILFNASALIAAALFFLVLLRHKLVKARLLSQQKIQLLEEEKKIMMARNLVEGQEEERKRIAMELHDGLGVILSATKMQFGSVRSEFPSDARVLDKAIALLEQATGEVRRISHNMMPGLLTKLGLFEAIEDLFDTVNESGSLEAAVKIETAKEFRLPENTEIMIYRIVQEMVNNTLKYANASRVELSMNVNGSGMIITYRDDGVGFSMEEVFSSDRKSLGLKSIESRVGFLSGEMSLKTEPGKGVDYNIEIPI